MTCQGIQIVSNKSLDLVIMSIKKQAPKVPDPVLDPTLRPCRIHTKRKINGGDLLLEGGVLTRLADKRLSTLPVNWGQRAGFGAYFFVLIRHGFREGGPGSTLE